ncbi:winged helix-turn-helix domain-containing protein [Actinorhabdospora filicis]|nr:helix-turn-helix domain-containing protein [Actinorhabdospora filicis]
MAEEDPREITELELLRSLAQPRRQQIVQHLTAHGPATSAGLARALGLNTGATSYHLRELARQGFIEEVPEKAHGRERWWRVVRRDVRFPRRADQDAPTRLALDEISRQSLAADLDAYTRALAETQGGAWADLPYSRSTITVDHDRLREFFEEYIALVNRFREAGGDGARRVQLRFLAFPADPVKPG